MAQRVVRGSRKGNGEAVMTYTLHAGFGLYVMVSKTDPQREGPLKRSGCVLPGNCRPQCEIALDIAIGAFLGFFYSSVNAVCYRFWPLL